MKSGGPEGLGRGSWFNLEQAPSFWGVGSGMLGSCWLVPYRWLSFFVGNLSRLLVSGRDPGLWTGIRLVRECALLFPTGSRAGPESFGVKVKMWYRLDTF